MSDEPTPIERGKKTDFFEPVEKYLKGEVFAPEWWAVGAWAKDSHGAIAGEPKARKSWCALDLALSFATGTPFLGQFTVPKLLRVGMIQAEMSDAGLIHRIHQISEAKGIGAQSGRTNRGTIWVKFFPDIPFYLRNRKPFYLDNVDHMKELEEQIVACGLDVCFFDPVARMLETSNENTTEGMRYPLNRLLEIKANTGCAPIIIHHYGKFNPQTPRTAGQRMRGASDFHAWVDSAMYLTKDSKDVTHVQPEFRDFRDSLPYAIEYKEEDEYVVEVNGLGIDKGKTDLEKYVISQKEPLRAKPLAAKFGINDHTLKRRAEKSRWIEYKVLTMSDGSRRAVVRSREG